MRRFLLLPSEPQFGPTEVVLEIPHAVVATLTLELSLLLAGLAESLQFRAKTGASVVIKLVGGKTVSKASVKRESADVVRFDLGRNQVEFLHVTFLLAHRDGAAEVNHVHVEGVLGDELFDLTVMFERFKEPMSAEEANKMLCE
jgi:hypothetical protein